MERLWDTPEKKLDLMCEMVSWESVHLTQGEIDFPVKAKKKLEQLDYFKQNPELLELSEVNWGRTFLTALYKHEEAKDTIVLISHFDTVSIEDYGELQPLACKPRELTAALHDRKTELTEEVRKDLESGEYLFGRGTMDMKAGLAIHMALLEKASVEKWPVNILLLTVPDEEINSNGMRTAVAKLVTLEEQHELDYVLFLNSEPVFALDQHDHDYKVYSGSIGKILPAALFYGKTSHVSEPLSGITSNFMASFLTQEMSWNPLFREVAFGESAPLPLTVLQQDLTAGYSAQIPFRAAALYNVFLLDRSAAETFDLFERTAKQALVNMNRTYHSMCKREGVTPAGEVRLLRYEDLKSHAVKKFGSKQIERMIAEYAGDPDMDVRQQSIAISDYLLSQCQELTPAVVLMFAPPYYPPVNSSYSGLVQDCIRIFTEKAQAVFGLEVKQSHYFSGISDLSYVNFQEQTDGWVTYERNTPVYGNTYSIPFEGMQRLQAPVLNIGPFGRDPHQRSERLHIRNAFEEVPFLLEEMITSVFLNVYMK